MSDPGLTWSQEEDLYFSSDNEPPRPIPTLPEETPHVIDKVKLGPKFPNPQAYKHAIARIVRQVALEHGWREAEVALDIHDTATTGTHRPAHPRRGATVIGSGRRTIHTPDDPHITVHMSSREFPDLDTTYHILTTVTDDSVPNPRKREHIMNYPGGFPYHVLAFLKLSLKSQEMPTPKREYEKRYQKWVAKQRKIADKNAAASGGWSGGGGGAPPGAGAGASRKPPGNSGAGGNSGGKGGSGGSGKTASTNPFAALGDLDEGESDKHGNPVYYANVYVKDKVTTQRVAVNAFGMEVKGSRYFCFNSTGDPFNQPPMVSKRDPNQKRAAQLYKIAKALYSGKITAPVQQTPYDQYGGQQAQYNLPIHSSNPSYGPAAGASSTYSTGGYYYDDPNASYRPSTSSSGGSGEYTTRPGSRGSTSGHDGYTAAPRTAAHDTHYATGSSYGHPTAGYAGYTGYSSNPGSRPSSSGSAAPGQPPVFKNTAPRPPAASVSQAKPPATKPPSGAPAANSTKQIPRPPRKVKPDTGGLFKDTFTVHGFDKNRPYIKGLDKKRPDQPLDLHYSEKNKQFYVCLGESRKDRVYLNAVKG